MKRGLVPVYSVLVVAIVLLAIFVPSCGGPAPTTGAVVVQATLCGTPWQGAVNYTLTPAGGSPVNGTSVPTTHSSMAPGTWTCAYVSGSPSGAFLNSIKPSASQSLAAGGTITFTFDFELNQDAGIAWTTATMDGSPNGGMIFAAICHMIGARFEQWVNGCDGHNVTINETSWLSINLTAGPGAYIYLVDDWCAVNKTPPLCQKVSQTPSIDNMTDPPGGMVVLFPGVPILLEVHTQWQLVNGVNYTKNINWFGISQWGYQPGVHPCALFELVVMESALYTFTIQIGADVTLVGDTDVDPGNNQDMSAPITLVLNMLG